MFNQAQIKIKLYCLHFAGGNSYSFRPFKAKFPHFIEPIFLELPGRGLRLREPLLNDLEQAVKDLLPHFTTQEPYAIYGHSMGGLLAYQLTQQLMARKQNLPLYLLISGCRAPRFIPRKEARHLLSKAQFFNMLQALGGLPKEILAHQELMEFFEPVLRADFQLIDTYHYHPSAVRLPMPVSILGGQQDKEVSYAELNHWQEECALPIRLHYWTGDHFFIFEKPDNIMEELTYLSQATLTPSLAHQLAS
jgi:surfactin synthase thioesterase subunit